MILCVDTRSLDTAPYVQKDIDLGDILLNHTKYYESAAEAEKDLYVPLDFSTSVRTVYTNKVLQIKEGDKYFYYVNHTNVGQFVHKGYDLVMYLSAIGLMSYVDYSYAFDETMLKYSEQKPMGIYNPDPGFFNPIVYSHIIIADEAEEQFKTFLKSGVDLVTFDVMEHRKRDSLTALLDTLKYVEKKEETVNE